MAQWVVVALLAAMLAVILESRLAFGARIVRIERDMAWLIAGLKKWGFVAPDYEVSSRMAAKLHHDERPIEPPKRP